MGEETVLRLATLRRSVERLGRFYETSLINHLTIAERVEPPLGDRAPVEIDPSFAA